MALKKEVFVDIVNQFSSYKKIYPLLKEILLEEKLTIAKVLKTIFTLLLVVLFSYFLVKYISFTDSFNYIVDINLMISVGLIGLLIGGFSIVMSSVTKDTLYCLILYKGGSKHSFYKTTLLRCMEPLIYFFILLSISFIFKLIFLLAPAINFPPLLVPSIKIIVLSILIYTAILSLKSLEVFLVNMYNILTAHTRFELMDRYAHSTGQNIDVIISDLENTLNTSHDSKNNWDIYISFIFSS